MNEEFYQKVSAELDRVASSDETLSALLKKIQFGEADFQDTQKYSQKFSELIGNVLFQNVAAVTNAGSKEFACLMMLQDYHQNINEILSIVQKSLDQKASIQIKPQKAAFPLERAKQAAHSLEDQRVPVETIQRRAEQAVANIANSFHDDYIQENAKFRSDAGLTSYITRTTTGKCCAWCSQIAGRYEYGRHPADVFCRHDNCDCIVTYENGKKRQNVWTKKTWSAPDIPDEALSFTPTVFTPEQARAVERQNLQYKGLTIPGKTGTIELRDTNSRYKPVTNEAINNMPDLSLFTSDRMNQAYRQANQDLLREVAKHSNLSVGTEFSIVYDANMKRIPGYDYVIGKVGSVPLNPPNEPFHAFHNHASGETFSYADLYKFAGIENMLSLTATGNAGNIYNVLKTANADTDGYWNFLNQKNKEVIYQIKDSSTGQNIEISHKLLQKKSKEISAKLTPEQKEELTQKLVDWSIECVEGAENYGIRYTKQTT